MGKKINYKTKIKKVLDELEKSHPNHTYGMHISIAFGEYRIDDLWNLPDKEFLFTLEKYQTELELDNSHIAPADYVCLIEKDAKENLFGNIDEEEEDI